MFSPGGGLGQTIAVVDRSGKVVSTSRNLLSVFKEAKSAYREKKAEIAAAKEANHRPRGYTAGRAFTVDDVRSTTSSRRSSHHSPRSSHGEHHVSRPKISRSHTEGYSNHYNAARGLDIPTTDYAPSRLPQRPSYMESPAVLRSPTSASASMPYLLESQRSPERPLITPMSAPPVLKRSFSVDNIDMNLAYGEPPPNLMTAYKDNDAELTGLVGRVKGLLDEAQCVQHSVSATMASLQKNPDAMAAVALTLAEISNLAKKMAPGALLKVRALAPSVFALLSSPQFLIAVGVGVGVTVIALGGYKVIKKIQAQREEEQPADQMIALSSEASRIENWRQGIADVEACSVGTSADGEFITPMAAQMSRLNLAEGSREAGGSSAPEEASGSSRGARSARSSSSRSSASSKPTTSKVEGSKQKRERRVKQDKKPKPSPLRNVFGF